MRLKETDRIDCRDENGEEYVVLEMTAPNPHVSKWGPRRGMKDSKHYVTSDGQHVSPLKDGRFEVFETKKVLAPRH